MLDRHADEADRVDVLDLAARAEPFAGPAHRHVDVGAQVALLHVAVAGAEITQDGAQLGEEGLGLLGGAQVGLGDDLHQRDAGAVEIDERRGRVLVVEELAGILLEMEPLDADPDRAVGHVDHDLALADHRRLVLADLVALRQVRIEIILAVEHRAQIDPRGEAEPGAHRLGDAFPVDHRQHARHRRIDQRHLRIGRGAERGGGAGEQLRRRVHLGVDLQADDDFPVAGRALDELAGLRRSVHVVP